MTERKLVVFIPGIAEKHLERIISEAAEKGFRTVVPEERKDAIREAADAEVLFTYDRSLCRHAPKLKWISTPFAGVEPLLEPGILEDPAILLTNSSGAYGVTIAEHVIMVTLEMMRRRAEYYEAVRLKRWIRDLHIDSIRGSRITLLGTGDIGRECAKRLRAFGPDSLTGVNRRGVNPDGGPAGGSTAGNGSADSFPAGYGRNAGNPGRRKAGASAGDGEACECRPGERGGPEGAGADAAGRETGGGCPGRI